MLPCNLIIPKPMPTRRSRVASQQGKDPSREDQRNPSEKPWDCHTVGISTGSRSTRYSTHCIGHTACSSIGNYGCTDSYRTENNLKVSTRRNYKRGVLIVIRYNLLAQTIHSKIFRTHQTYTHPDKPASHSLSTAPVYTS
jgi:hypothetical protein